MPYKNLLVVIRILLIAIGLAIWHAATIYWVGEHDLATWTIIIVTAAFIINPVTDIQIISRRFLTNHLNKNFWLARRLNRPGIISYIISGIVALTISTSWAFSVKITANNSLHSSLSIILVALSGYAIFQTQYFFTERNSTQKNQPTLQAILSENSYQFVTPAIRLTVLLTILSTILAALISVESIRKFESTVNTLGDTSISESIIQRGEKGENKHSRIIANFLIISAEYRDSTMNTIWDTYNFGEKSKARKPLYTFFFIFNLFSLSPITLGISFLILRSITFTGAKNEN